MQATRGKDRIKWTAQYVALDTGANDEQTVALFEALRTEANFANPDHGDSDSEGVLQQRPSKGWGPESEVMNPELAMRKFMARAKKARQGRGPEVIAQDVQRSACDGTQMPPFCNSTYGGNYAKHETEAVNTINQLRAESASKGTKS